MTKSTVFSLSIFLLLLLSACAAPQVAPEKPALDTEGEVYLYLQPLPQEAHGLTFTVAGISLAREDGSETELLRGPVTLSGRELIGAQKKLAAAIVPPGAYSALAITVTHASLLGEEGETDLLVPDQPVTVEAMLTVARRQALALFLALAPEKPVTAGFSFTPAFSLIKPDQQLANFIGFVSQETANAVSVFNKRTAEVVDVLATGRRPLGLALDQDKGWLYVALAGRSAVAVIDATTRAPLGTIRLHTGAGPTELALSPDGRTLVTANFGSSSTSIVDTRSLLEEARVSLDSEPTDVAVDPAGRRAYVLQSLTGTLSVVDLARREVTASSVLEETPEREGLSPDGRSLYLTTRYSPHLLVVDLSSLSVARRIFIGPGAVCLKVDPRTGLVYVGKRQGEIDVIDPSAGIALDFFRVSGEPLDLAIDNEENALWVVLPGEGLVEKIDLVSKKRLAAPEVQSGSHAVVVMGER